MPERREDGNDIVACGECRVDPRQPEHAHLGVIVAEARRGTSLGGRMMNSLVLASRNSGLEPLCSTEPDNLAARRMIHRAGFRARHRVFRVSFEPGPGPDHS